MFAIKIFGWLCPTILILKCSWEIPTSWNIGIAIILLLCIATVLLFGWFTPVACLRWLSCYILVASCSDLVLPLWSICISRFLIWCIVVHSSRTYTHLGHSGVLVVPELTGVLFSAISSDCSRHWLIIDDFIHSDYSVILKSLIHASWLQHWSCFINQLVPINNLFFKLIYLHITTLYLNFTSLPLSIRIHVFHNLDWFSEH